jgi:hypothetical protein
LALLPFLLPLERRILGRALATWAGILSFLLLSLILLLGRPERGAYLLPCVAPIAVLAPRAFFRPVLALLVVASLWASLTQQLEHDRAGEKLRGFVAGVRALEQERPVVLWLAAPDELGAVLQGWPELFRQQRMFLLAEVAARPVDEAQLRATMAAAAQHAWGAGRQLLVGSEGLRYLAGDPDKLPAGAALERALAETFAREPLRRDGFDGFRLLPRR